MRCAHLPLASLSACITSSRNHAKSCHGAICLNWVVNTGAFLILFVVVCQGMSDMVAPILFVMHDEAEAFWCFACLMEKLEVCPAFALSVAGLRLSTCMLTRF